MTHLDRGSRSHSLFSVIFFCGGLAFLLIPVLLFFFLLMGSRSPRCVGAIMPTCSGALPVGLHPLQQGHNSFGLWELGDLEVLLVVGCVFADEPLPATGQWPGSLRLPLFTFTVFPRDQCVLCKVHCGLCGKKDEGGCLALAQSSQDPVMGPTGNSLRLTSPRCTCRKTQRTQLLRSEDATLPRHTW